MWLCDHTHACDFEFSANISFCFLKTKYNDFIIKHFIFLKKKYEKKVLFCFGRLLCRKKNTTKFFYFLKIPFLQTIIVLYCTWEVRMTNPTAILVRGKRLSPQMTNRALDFFFPISLLRRIIQNFVVTPPRTHIHIHTLTNTLSLLQI